MSPVTWPIGTVVFPDDPDIRSGKNLDRPFEIEALALDNDHSAHATLLIAIMSESETTGTGLRIGRHERSAMASSTREQ